MSDGSDSLRVLSPATFQVQRVVHVRYKDAPVLQVNELEYANGEVLANVERRLLRRNVVRFQHQHGHFSGVHYRIDLQGSATGNGTDLEEQLKSY